jgi:hypothetical protein
MASNIYPINKGINKSVEFKGLKAQYIWWLGGVVIAAMIVFAVLYIAGVSAYLCIPVVGGLGAAGITRVYRMSRRFGEHGLMKWRARTSVPKVVHVRSRKPFLRRFS